MEYSKLKVKFKNDRLDREFSVLHKPVVKGEAILDVETPDGWLLINMEETYYVEYNRGVSNNA